MGGPFRQPVSSLTLTRGKEELQTEKSSQTGVETKRT